MEKKKVKKKEKKKEKIKILGIYCAAFGLSTFIALYIFLFMLFYCWRKGIDEVSGVFLVFILPGAYLIRDFIYFLRRIKEKIEYEPIYAFILFLSGTTVFLFFCSMEAVLPY